MKKKHHYIPQFYLRNFLNNQDKIFVFDKITKKISIQSEKGTFWEKFLYRVDFEKHEKITDQKIIEQRKKSWGLSDVDISNEKIHPDMIEDDLLGLSENLNKPIIDKIIRNEKIDSKEKRELSSFISLMYVRNPVFLERIDNAEKRMYEGDLSYVITNEYIIDEFIKKELLTVPKEKLLNCYKNKNYRVKIPQEKKIFGMLSCAHILDGILYPQTFILLKCSKETSFLTSDNPVFIYKEVNDILRDEMFGSGNTIIFGNEPYVFPISKEYVLVVISTIYNGKIIVFNIDKKTTRKWNDVIFEYANNYIISKDEDLLKYISKNKDLDIKHYFEDISFGLDRKFCIDFREIITKGYLSEIEMKNNLSVYVYSRNEHYPIHFHIKSKKRNYKEQRFSINPVENITKKEDINTKYDSSIINYFNNHPEHIFLIEKEFNRLNPNLIKSKN